jgi:hypothetical protein
LLAQSACRTLASIEDDNAKEREISRTAERAPASCDTAKILDPVSDANCGFA